MLDYMLMPFRRYAEFTGRSRRSEFWWFAVFNSIVYAILGILLVMGGFSTGTFAQLEENPATVISLIFFSGFGILFFLYWAATVIPTIAVTVRRLHDRDMSGWWYLGFLIASGIPLVGPFASIALFVILLLPGTVGPNRFGPDPKDPNGVDVFG